jgi:8-oxo-dGTP diphosphatase
MPGRWRASGVRSDPALAPNCGAPPGDGAGYLPCVDGRQLSTEGRIVRPTLPGLFRRLWAVGRIVGGRSGESGDRQEHDGPVVIRQQSIGVGVIVVRGGAVLFGMRRGAHGASSWSFPGGHLDGDESVETCAIRELHEEAGIEVINARVVAETEDDFGVGFRYRTLFVQGDWAGGEPTVREPDKCAEWGWFSWDDPPQPLLSPVASLRATGFRPAAKTARLASLRRSTSPLPPASRCARSSSSVPPPASGSRGPLRPRSRPLLARPSGQPRSDPDRGRGDRGPGA